jgi:hypothetical protein
MTDRREELLQARVDGELTSDERHELERLLEEDASTRLRAGELDALSKALNVLGPEDPPARVLRAVIDHVKHNAPEALPEYQTTATGGLMRTKVLWGLAAAAGIVLAALAYTGFPPESGGSEGAIGAAKRYQAGQIAASDVKLGDQAAQEFLQSDLFDKLMKDDATRKLLSDDNFRQMAGRTEFRNLLLAPELKGLLDTSALADGKVALALANDDLAFALSSEELGGAFANAHFRRALEDPEFRLRLSGELRQLATNTDLRNSVQNDVAFKGELRNLETQLGLLKSEAFLRALNSVEFRRVAFSDQFLKIFSDAQLVAALESAEFRNLLVNSNLRAGLRVAGLSQALSNQNFRQLAASGALHQALKNDLLIRALESNDLAAALSSPRFGEALRVGYSDR